MAYSNTALCELSTAMTDLTGAVSFEGALGSESSRAMKTTNAGLCLYRVSTRDVGGCSATIQTRR